MEQRKSKLLSVSQIFESDPNHFLSFYLHLSKRWKDIVGEEMASYLKPVGFSNSCLCIRVPSSCYVQEMNFKKEEILSKINHPKVKKIHFIF